MGMLAIDNIISQLHVDLARKALCTDVVVPTTIKCKLSEMNLDDLYDPNLYIRVRHGIMKDVPARKNRKKRIQKKWIKRYGMRQVVSYDEAIYEVISKELNFSNDTVKFYCKPTGETCRFTRNW